MNIRRVLCLLVLFFPMCALILLSVSRAAAFDYPRLISRSLSLGTTEPGVSTDYTFSWRWPSSSSIGSVRFLLCSDPYVLDTCSSTPPGDFSGAVLDSQSGALGGFGISNQSANEIVISRGLSGATGTGQYTFVFDDVINPTGLQQPFFVQIFTYSSTDASGTPSHVSSVANATTTAIGINTKVPPILYFCAALTISEWCNHVSGSYIDYGDLSAVVTDLGNSQFGVATNALGGYVVTVNGKTMTSGNKEIAAITVPSASSIGTAQFGINLRANTDPPTGQDAIGTGIGTVAADYDTPDMFLYNDGDVVASAVTGSMFNTYTVTYVVNVPSDQPSGVYNTTITYICTASF